MNDVFISYTSADRPWAEWIAWVLEENGYTITAQALDGRPGENLVNNVQQAISQPGFTVLVLSENYITAADAEPNWPLPSQQDPTLTLSRVLPIRVETCQLPKSWGLPEVVNIVDQSETEAEQAILDSLQGRGVQDTDSDSFSIEQIQNQPWKLRRQLYTVYGFKEQLTEALSIEMMQIPAGSFMMGSPEDELERDIGEGPQHQVDTPTFFMGKYPITQAQWRFVAELPQVNRELKPNPSGFEGERNPVEKVSWFEAVEFCDRLSLHTGRPYRLPAEVEWEYACRAGTTTPFHFGETISTDLANYRGTDWKEMGGSGSYDRGPKGEYREKTTPVDFFGVANAFGLCAMHGNVWEWCQDQWHDNYEGASTDSIAWLDEKSDDEKVERVIRGGSWDFYPRSCRSASRSNSLPREFENDIGFRVVCIPPRTLE
ncbi:MAG: SUMF1/EgtB/PvdO family nonheme iron enzyme [Leptolyngbyaceae cyanobacterium MO_188.B28]|nr:SUMF1/EgtB/PvdO family nonheme iron enzyme [Leptolyngbyaceae cyanobacterium MO_188.B28]